MIVAVNWILNPCIILRGDLSSAATVFTRVMVRLNLTCNNPVVPYYSSECFEDICVLVSRATPPNPRERGVWCWRPKLVASNQIRDLNLLLGNALLAARAQYSRPRIVCGYTRDVFCNYCIPTEQLAVRMVTRPLFPHSWSGRTTVSPHWKSYVANQIAVA